jgi:predicted peptidase
MKTSQLILLIFFLLPFLISCSVSRKPFGLKVCHAAPDSTISKQLLTKIKSLENAVFDSAVFSKTGYIDINYRLFKPKETLENKKYPLVVVFHGSAQIGTNNLSQLGLLPKLFASVNIQEKYPAFILAPQFSTRSSDYVLDSSRNVLKSVPRPCLLSVLSLIDSLKMNPSIDASRIYAVGFSMGGSTVINSISTRPDLFAAGVSISGIPQFDELAALHTVPIWLIHGVKDTENPIDSDEQFFKEKRHKILFWKLPNASHDNVFSFDLLDETIPKWLFHFRKK